MVYEIWINFLNIINAPHILDSNCINPLESVRLINMELMGNSEMLGSLGFSWQWFYISNLDFRLIFFIPTHKISINSLEKEI